MGFITLQKAYKRPQRLTNAECESLSRLSRQRYGAVIVGAYVHMDKHCTKNPPVAKKKKQIPSFCQGHIPIRTDLNPFTGFIREMKQVHLTWARMAGEKMSACLTNPIKELKAENKELAELKSICLLKLKSRMKCPFEARERARTWANELLKQK